MKINYIKDQIKFNTNEFQFRELLLNHINKSLEDNKQKTINKLDEIHNIEGIEDNIEFYRQIAFDCFKSIDFQIIYKKFGLWLIKKFYSEKALIQKTPTIRIQLSKGKSVSFHTDEWYGHGDVNSFWLPMTKVEGENSLQIAKDLNTSINLKNKIIKEKLTLDEINAEARKICEPVDANYGDVIIFNKDIIHGTIINNTEKSRVSFDFRISPNINNLGNKPQSNYFFFEDLMRIDNSENELQTKKIALMYTGTCRNVSSKNQAIFLKEFSTLNNIDVIAAESEIIIFDYCPVLLKYIINPEIEINQILLYGVDLLPRDKDKRFRVYDEAIKNNIELVFASEDIVLSNKSQTIIIEKLLSKTN